MTPTLNSEFVLPVGDDLRVFLNQDTITDSLLKTILRHRGVFLASGEKKDMLEYLLLSFLTPDEFEMMLESIRIKEDSFKMRTKSFTVSASDSRLADMMPAQFDVRAIASDPYGNSQIQGNPIFSGVPGSQGNSYTMNVRIERLNYTSDWLQSRREFDSEVRLDLDPEKKTLKITTYHTSKETEKANRRIIQHLAKDFKGRNLIDQEEPKRITFGSFSNEQRILFFMLFTGLQEYNGLTFKKFSDLSLRLDETKTIPNQERLDWMRQNVTTVKLKGEALQETFFVKDISARPFLIFWRIDAVYTFDLADESGTFTAVLEFADFGKDASPSSDFQISIPSLSIDGKGQAHPDCAALKKQFLMKLNTEKDKAFEKAQKSGT